MASSNRGIQLRSAPAVFVLIVVNVLAFVLEIYAGGWDDPNVLHLIEVTLVCPEFLVDFNPAVLQPTIRHKSSLQKKLLAAIHYDCSTLDVTDECVCPGYD